MNLPHQVAVLPTPAHERRPSCRRDLTQRRGGAGTQGIETVTDGPWTLASLRLGVSALVPRVAKSYAVTARTGAIAKLDLHSAENKQAKRCYCRQLASNSVTEFSRDQ